MYSSHARHVSTRLFVPAAYMTQHLDSLRVHKIFTFVSVERVVVFLGGGGSVKFF